jgi:hypothetical protein
VLIRPTPDRPTRLEDLLPAELAARLDRLDVLSRKVFAGKLPGERRSKRRGLSVEFDDYRQYAPGDDLRHVDWNVFARLDRFFIKIFREDEDLVVHLVIDDSASMSGGAGPEIPSKSIYARRLATALGYIGLVNQNRVVVERFGGARPRRLAPIRGRRQLDRLAAFLLEDEHTEPGRAPTPPEAFDAAMRRITSARAGHGVVVVLSDFLFREGIEKGLNYLAGGLAGGGVGYDGCCLQILSPGELDPSSLLEDGLRGDVRLTDIETGRAAEISITRALIDRYQRRLRAHIADLEGWCRARRMRHVLLGTATPVESVILDSLRRQRLVG